MQSSDIDEIYQPSSDLTRNSNINQWMKTKNIKTEQELRFWYKDNLMQFWDEMAKSYATWFRIYSKILEKYPPKARWFVGGKCNVAYNAIDRHAKGERKDKIAYIFVPERADQSIQKITYLQLYQEVNKFANGLKSLGIKKGDNVCIYMPNIPEAVIAMLACSKIGAIHSNVGCRFNSDFLKDVLIEAKSVAVITVDGLFSRERSIPLKDNVDTAIKSAQNVKNTVVVKRTKLLTTMKPKRDIWWDELIAHIPQFQFIP
jgi:acetyl-CoA synthetase